MQRNLRLAHTAISSIRRTMDGLAFVDVWTPSMTRGTPEGARLRRAGAPPAGPVLRAGAVTPDLQAALHDRWARPLLPDRDVLADEDLRADRQFEFRQLDLEMAFVEREDVLDVLEEVVVDAFASLGREAPARPFPTLTYADAMRGTAPTSRPSLRARDPGRDRAHARLGVRRLWRVPRPCVIRRAARVLAQRARAARGDREGVGRRGSRTSCTTATMRSPIAKFSVRELEVPGEPGSTVLFAAGDETTVARVLGGLRIHLGRELELASDKDLFHWVIDFPLFEIDEDTGNWTFLHHPFTAPVSGHEDRVAADPGNALSQHYDLIWNGWELGSGSIRIHRADIQQDVFRTMGMSDEEAHGKFAFLLDALAMGLHRTAASRWASSAWYSWPASRTSAGHRVPEGVERIRSADGRSVSRPTSSSATSASGSSRTHRPRSRAVSHTTAVRALLGQRLISSLAAVALLPGRGRCRDRRAARFRGGRGGAHERAGTAGWNIAFAGLRGATGDAQHHVRTGARSEVPGDASAPRAERR